MVAENDVETRRTFALALVGLLANSLTQRWQPITRTPGEVRINLSQWTVIKLELDGRPTIDLRPSAIYDALAAEGPPVFVPPPSREQEQP